MGDVAFAARGLTYRYPGATRLAVQDVDLSIAFGELVVLVGPNGSGKTSLVRLALGVLRPTAGAVDAFGRPAASWKRRDLARRIGVVTQREEPTFPLRVRQAVSLGRYAHLGPFQPFGSHDERAVDEAMARADATDLAERWTATLSGGEWQRVRLARALAQEPRALVLDEPTANLDLGHEMEVFELVADLVRRHHLTALVVTHHVNLAARFADRVVVMHDGCVCAAGRPRDVLTGVLVERVFAWPVDVLRWGDEPLVVPLRRRAPDAVRVPDPPS